MWSGVLGPPRWSSRPTGGSGGTRRPGGEGNAKSVDSVLSAKHQRLLKREAA